MKKQILLFISFLLLISHIMHARVVEITSEEQFNRDILAPGKKAVVKFSAVWCGPCQMLKKPYQELSDDAAFKDIIFAAIDIDKMPKLTSKYHIHAVPTLIYIIDGKTIESHSGCPSNLKSDVTRVLQKTTESELNGIIPIKEEKIAPTDHPGTSDQEGGFMEQVKGFFYDISKKAQEGWEWIKRSVSNLF